ncbi:MAG TPA: hypothetical protein VK203_31045 [Nostocaceae cyanobacterium]|nr:hypothetical protein [Nostocaceae cyanobacterium]
MVNGEKLLQRRRSSSNESVGKLKSDLFSEIFYEKSTVDEYRWHTRYTTPQYRLNLLT